MVLGFSIRLVVIMLSEVLLVWDYILIEYELSRSDCNVSNVGVLYYQFATSSLEL